MLRNLMKMLSGVLTPIVYIVVTLLFLGCFFLAFRCPPLIPVVAVPAFLGLCFLDARKRKKQRK